MSHDRGCACGKEPYEYDECKDTTCSRSPVYIKPKPRVMPTKTVTTSIPAKTVITYYDTLYGEHASEVDAAKSNLAIILATAQSDRSIEGIIRAISENWGIFSEMLAIVRKDRNKGNPDV